jgi:hypothetical protein
MLGTSTIASRMTMDGVADTPSNDSNVEWIERILTYSWKW